MRLIAQRYQLQYQEPIPCENLVSNLCNVKQAYTQFGGKRPFGVSILYMGWDKQFGYQLYQSDPSGNYGGWKATCIGNNNQVDNIFNIVKLVNLKLLKFYTFIKTAISILKQEYKIGETKLTDALKLAIKILNKTLDTTKLTSEKSKINILKIYIDI